MAVHVSHNVMSANLDRYVSQMDRLLWKSIEAPEELSTGHEFDFGKSITYGHAL